MWEVLIVMCQLCLVSLASDRCSDRREEKRDNRDRDGITKKTLPMQLRQSSPCPRDAKLTTTKPAKTKNEVNKNKCILSNSVSKHSAEDEQKTTKTKTLTLDLQSKVTMVTDLIEFTQSVHNDLVGYLDIHTMEPNRRPYVSTNYSVDEFKREYPQEYKRAKRRTRVSQRIMNDLTVYLCQRYRMYLVGTTHIYGRVQRMEDLVDFILEKYADNIKAA